MAGLVTQVSLGGGEISPYLFARADLNKFKVGAAKLLNMHVRTQGGVFNRSGTKFVDFSYNVSGAYKKAKFIPFDAEDNDTLVLLFSDNKLTFIRTGAYVKFIGTVVAAGRPGAFSETAGTVGQTMSLTTPWTQDEVYKLKKTQSEDVMTITCEGHDPYELRRYGYYDWGLFVVDTAPKIAFPVNVVATATVNLTVPSGVAAPTIYNRNYYYVVSAVDASGNESLASAASSCINDLSWAGNYNLITWDAVVGAVSYNVYKAVNSIYGFIGSTVNLALEDRNIAPNLSDTPKTGRNPFADANRKPEVVEFHQSRRWFANYGIARQSFDASGSDAYSDFNVSVPAKDDDAIAGTIAARRRQAIYWFVPLTELVVFTQSGEWKFIGGNNDGDTITPSSIDARPQSTYGCRKYIQPIVVGSRILFIQALGGVLYDMGYEITQNKYVADELSALSSHLFEGRVAVNWSYDIKNHILWIVMSDGKAVSYTYHREHELWAASQHETDGKYLDVLCIPEGDDIVTYFMTDRKNSDGTVRCIEKVVNRYQRDPLDSFFVDCGLSHDVPVTITNVEILSTSTVRITTNVAHGWSNGTEVILSEIGGFKKIEGSDEFDQGLNKKFVIANVASTTFEIPFDSTYTEPWDEELTAMAARKLFTTFSGFDHLKGRKVAVLGDGAVYEGIEVTSGGQIVLPRAVGRLHAGLGYLSQFHSLDIDIGTETTQGVVKKVNKVHMMVNKSRGINVGSSPDPARMTEEFPRSHEDFDTPPSMKTGYVSVTCEANHEPTGLVYAEQRYPLPMEILSVTPDIEYGNQN